MLLDRHAVRPAWAVLTAASLLLPRSAPLLVAQSETQPATSVARDADGGWPRDDSTPSGGSIRIFQPQVASWDGQRHMIAYAAVSYTAKGESKPALGTVKLEANTL